VLDRRTGKGIEALHYPKSSISFDGICRIRIFQQMYLSLQIERGIDIFCRMHIASMYMANVSRPRHEATETERTVLEVRSRPVMLFDSTHGKSLDHVFTCI
jgi:hypothetical protein